jgi:hypothetical protein
MSKIFRGKPPDPHSKGREWKGKNFKEWKEEGKREGKKEKGMGGREGSIPQINFYD